MRGPRTIAAGALRPADRSTALAVLLGCSSVLALSSRAAGTADPAPRRNSCVRPGRDHDVHRECADDQSDLIEGGRRLDQLFGRQQRHRQLRAAECRLRHPQSRDRNDIVDDRRSDHSQRSGVPGQPQWRLRLHRLVLFRSVAVLSPRRSISATPISTPANLIFPVRGASAPVSNAGQISGAPGSFVGLIGGTVANSGTITVPLGKVGLGAGEKVTLNPTGDGFLQVALPTQRDHVGREGADRRRRTHQGCRRHGRDQGRDRAAGGARRREHIRHDQCPLGVRPLRQHRPRWRRRRRSPFPASWPPNGGRRSGGGTVVVTGNKVVLTSTARVSANGASGGSVLIGGDLRGGDRCFGQARASAGANRADDVESRKARRSQPTARRRPAATLWSGRMR